MRHAAVHPRTYFIALFLFPSLLLSAFAYVLYHQPLSPLIPPASLFGAVLASGGLLLVNAVILALIMRTRQAEGDLRESEDRFRIVLHSINDGIYDYNVSSGSIYYSSSYKAMLGYTHEEHPDSLESFNRLLHPDDYEKTWETFRCYASREIPDYSNVFRLRHKDGGWRWILSRGVGLRDKSGRMVRLIGTHTDITEQKEREERLKNMNADLESFTYIASHDLRSPLVNLKGFASEIEMDISHARQLIAKLSADTGSPEAGELERLLTEDIGESLHFIRSSVEKMDRLTSAILDLSRIGRRELCPEKVDTRKTIQRSLDTLRYEIDERGIEITLGELPDITVDPLSFEQIVGNILDNAVKYMDPSRSGRIEIEGAVLSAETQFSIRDNGLGIAEEDRPKVFDIFRRAGNSFGVRGAGMGMAYVKAAVRRLGGRIWFDSMPGQGTTFHFTVPHRAVQGEAHG